MYLRSEGADVYRPYVAAYSHVPSRPFVCWSDLSIHFIISLIPSLCLSQRDVNGWRLGMSIGCTSACRLGVKVLEVLGPQPGNIFKKWDYSDILRSFVFARTLLGHIFVFARSSSPRTEQLPLAWSFSQLSVSPWACTRRALIQPLIHRQFATELNLKQC